MKSVQATNHIKKLQRYSDPGAEQARKLTEAHQDITLWLFLLLVSNFSANFFPSVCVCAFGKFLFYFSMGGPVRQGRRPPEGSIIILPRLFDSGRADTQPVTHFAYVERHNFSGTIDKWSRIEFTICHANSVRV